jgi:hypothetical protein
MLIVLMSLAVIAGFVVSVMLASANIGFTALVGVTVTFTDAETLAGTAIFALPTGVPVNIYWALFALYAFVVDHVTGKDTEPVSVATLTVLGNSQSAIASVLKYGIASNAVFSTSAITVFIDCAVACLTINAPVPFTVTV